MNKMCFINFKCCDFCYKKYFIYDFLVDNCVKILGMNWFYKNEFKNVFQNNYIVYLFKFYIIKNYLKYNMGVFEYFL